MAANHAIEWDLCGNNWQAYKVQSVIAESKGATATADSSVYELSSDTADENQFGALALEIDVKAYLGKRLKFSAKIKTEEANSGAGLWMRADRPDADPAFDNMWNRQIVGTFDWTEHKIVLLIPEDATKLIIGATLRGKGKCFIKDVRVETVGDDVPLTQMVFAPKPE